MACSIPGCDEPRFRTTNTCHGHWLARPRCPVEGCDRLAQKKFRGFCTAHYQPLSPASVKSCLFEGCRRRASSRGLCSAHAKQRHKGQDLRPLRSLRYQKQCSFDGCDRPTKARGLCGTHWQQASRGQELRTISCDNRASRRARPSCAFDGCDRLALGFGGLNVYCQGHRSQVYDDKPLRPLYEVRASTGYVNKAGYRLISIAGESVMEHRAVMAQVIGRPLEPFETVHHLNGDKLDNRPENLELWASTHQRGQRVADLIDFIVTHYSEQVRDRLAQSVPVRPVGPGDAVDPAEGRAVAHG